MDETYLECLLACNRDIILRPRQMLMLERVECTLRNPPATARIPTSAPSLLQPLFHSKVKGNKTYPFTINNHLRPRINHQILSLPNLANVLHIRRVTSRPEDDGDLGAGVDIVRGDEGSGCVVDDGGDVGRGRSVGGRAMGGVRGCVSGEGRDKRENVRISSAKP